MTPDEVIRTQLLDLLRGGHAHMPFAQAVAGFPLDAINRQPPSVSYTFWHLLEHLRIAQWDILEFIRNPDHVSPEWPKGYWPSPGDQIDPARWEVTIANFLTDLKALESLVSDPQTDLYGSLPHAPKYTILREILLVADHNAYHIGEFAILRQVTGLWPD